MQMSVRPQPEPPAREVILRALADRARVSARSSRSAWWLAGVRESLRPRPRPDGYWRGSS